MSRLSHGFTTREQWKSFFDEYQQKIHQLHSDSNDLIAKNMTGEEWIKKYQRNSEAIRKTACSLSEPLETHLRYFLQDPNRWSQESADSLTAYLFRQITRLEDLGTIAAVADSLIQFYTKNGNEIGLMKCHTVRSCCYLMLDAVNLGEEIISECKKAAFYYEKHFFNLTAEEQSMGLSIYDIALDQLTSVYHVYQSPENSLFPDILKFYEFASFAKLWVQNTDKDYEFNKILPFFDYYMAQAVLSLSLTGCTPAQAAIFYEAAEKVWTHGENGAESQFLDIRKNLIHLMAERLIGKPREKDIIKVLEQYTEQLYEEVLPASKNEGYNTFCAVQDVYLTADILLRNLDSQSDEVQGENNRLYRKITRLFAEYSSTLSINAYYNYISSRQNYYYLCRSAQYMDNPKSFLYYLVRLTIFRQVQTAIHSVMVGKLAVELAEALIAQCPECLIGQFETHSSQEVAACRERILDFVYTAALLHDIGKVTCPNVITQQYRKITDLEFQIIKQHPTAGGSILKNLPVFSIFHDIAMGHHKSYDGTFGYPIDFDNTKSPVRIFTDMITICDSLDAATDSHGRCYAQAKTVDMVLEEMEQSKNSRYSGFLVDFIIQNDTLKNCFRQLLTTGRLEAYYQIQQEIESRPGELIFR